MEAGGTGTIPPLSGFSYPYGWTIIFSHFTSLKLYFWFYAIFRLKFAINVNESKFSLGKISEIEAGGQGQSAPPPSGFSNSIEYILFFSHFTSFQLLNLLSFLFYAITRSSFAVNVKKKRDERYVFLSDYENVIPLKLFKAFSELKIFYFIPRRELAMYFLTLYLIVRRELAMYFLSQPRPNNGNETAPKYDGDQGWKFMSRSHC